MNSQKSPEDEARRKEAETWLKKGYSFERKNKHEEAIECYDKALNIEPDLADALDAKGWALANSGKYDEALGCFDNALRIKPKVSRIWNNKGVALEFSERFDEALKCYEKAIEIRPKFMFPWSNKGRILYIIGRFDEAISCYDKAIQIKQNNEYAWNGKGEVLLSIEKLEEARICFDRALSIDNKYALAWQNRATALSYLGKYEDSLTCYSKAVELDPESCESWARKGGALCDLFKFEEALDCCKKAIEIEPEDPYAWFVKGNVLNELGKYEEAMNCYEEVIKLNPESSYAWNGKGCAFYDTKNYEEALKCYDQAIHLDPDEPLFWSNKGEVLYDLKKYDKSLDCYNKSIELNPNDSEAWKGKGKVLEALGREKEADEAFRKAEEIVKIKGNKDPNEPEIISEIKLILERKGQVILYGPPGTGKTYWALRSARELSAISLFDSPFDKLDEDKRRNITGDKNAPGVVRMCSFHPAYGYEDFIEGYRPELQGDSQINFSLRDGTFKRLCKDAKNNPDTHFYLIIDEINRGDIPRIFGELMTVLEKNKRDKSMALPLSGELLKVPKNLYVIGTMNTADRSIALLDTALRRRFGFIELMPDIELLKDTSVRGVNLGQWLKSINRRIIDNLGQDARNRQIGHSYLLENGRPLSDFSRFAEVIRDEIIPLIEEYCYEDYSKMGTILGTDLVNLDKQMVRYELFEEPNYEALAKALQNIVSQEPLSEAGQ
jgi:tetratricopeptide (TPR) repeat protein